MLQKSKSDHTDPVTSHNHDTITSQEAARDIIEYFEAATAASDDVAVVS